MVEEIRNIIGNGFETFKKNLNICVPFVLNSFIAGVLAALVFVFGILYIFGPSLSGLGDMKDPATIASIILPLIKQHIIDIIILIMVILISILIIQSYFIAGAVGMAIQATESGESKLSTMLEAGKKNLLNMFLAEILFGLLSLAGIVFIVPGAMKLDFSRISASENMGGFVMLMGGFLVWVIYLVILGLIFSVFRYALVADGLGPIESLTASFHFFQKNRIDVFLLFIIIVAIFAVYFIVDGIMRLNPITNILWSIIGTAISVIVLPPLITIWWVRLFMVRTNRKIYVDELLAHPNDLKLAKGENS